MTRLLLAAALASCAQSGATVCPFDDRLVCPPETVCVQLTLPDENACVSPASIAACDGRASRGPCPLGGDENGDGEPDEGRCYDGVCLPIVCGNGRIDFEEGEVCDDRNGITGDGCSANCLSDETCGNGIIDPFVDGGARSELCDDKNDLAFDGCSSACRPERAAWTNLSFSDVPPGRQGALVVYQARHQRLLMFGGYDDANFSGARWTDTLEWDGSAWRDVTPLFGPTGRSFASGAYDVHRDRVVMFGGQTRNSVIAETWEWDGLTWRPRPTSVAPSARERAAMVYDPRRGVSVLVGGAAGGAQLGDTWEWDGTTWTERTDVGTPGQLAEHALVYDPLRNVIVLLGYDEKRRTQVHWELEGTQWMEKKPTALPPPRRGTMMAFDAERQQLVVFGGGTVPDDDRLDQLWAYDGTTWTQVTSKGGRARRDGGLVTIADRETPSLWLAAGVGLNQQHYSDVQAWDPATETWSTVISSAMTGIEWPAAVHDPLRHLVVVHGSFSGLPMTYELGSSWRGPIVTTGMPVEEFAMAYDPVGARTVLFGGRIGGGNTSDTWTWHGTAWNKLTVTGAPAARRGHAMAYDAARQQIVMFGGARSITDFAGDTHVLAGAAWTPLTPATSPSPRHNHAMAYDPIRKRVVLFGGEDLDPQVMVSRIVGDTWEWDGTTWTLAVPTFAPVARRGAVLAWHPVRRTMVLFGGVTAENTSLDDTWEWDGVEWRRVELTSAPTTRDEAALVTSPDGDGVVVIGGRRTAASWVTEVMQLRWTSELVERESCSGYLDGDSDGLVGCDDPSCWHRCDPLCMPGMTSCDADRPRCGDGVCSPLESCRSCASDCGTCAAVCGDFVCDANEACPGDCVSPP